MAKRISILVALDGADEGLQRALGSAEKSLGVLAASAKTAGDKAAAGLAEVKAGVDAFGEQITRAKGQLLAFVSINWVVGKAQEIVAVADAWNSLAARLRLATAGQHEFATAQQELYGIAQRIGVPLEETAKLYGKLQQSVRMLGGEQQQALTLTESIAQALRISGASATEAQAALLQFGQALAAGVLRGEEFNSVVENSPRLAQALADGLNVPIGRLRKLAEEGRLTADVVVNALLSQKDRLASEYAQLPPTVGQAFTRLQNAFGQWVHEVDAGSGATAKLAAALTTLAEHLGTVLAVLTRVAELGLGVLVYRMLPALVTAWQTVAAAGVTAANAIAAAWATVNLSVSGAVAGIGVLKTAFGVLSAFVVGWELGSWLQEKFAVVRQAGLLLVQGLLTGIEHLRYGWEAFAALFTADTLAAATQRHQQRLTEMRRIFGEMSADAGRSAQATAAAMAGAGSAAESVLQRLAAVRQGTQEAVGRGLEAVHDAVGKLKSVLGELEQQAGKVSQRVNDALGRMAEATKGLTAQIDAALQRQVEASKNRLQQEQAALAASHAAQATQIVRGTQLLTEALAQQTTLRQQAAAATLRLLDDEAQARLSAAARQGKTEEERVANLRRVEAEILAAKQQTLTQALADYRQHVEALNAAAQRHLAEVKRIEDEKRLLHASTEDRIRELQRTAMDAYGAYQDKLSQVTDLQAKARAAISAGEFDRAREYAKQAQELAAQTAGAVVDGDRTVVSQKEAVARAVSAIRDAEQLAIQALEGEGQAHQKAAEAALAARAGIEATLTATQQQLTAIETQLQESFRLTIDADTTQVITAVAELDRLIVERARLLVIETNLEQAQKELQRFEQLLKEGKELPVGADVGKAKAALEQLKTYADEKTNLELRVTTDKAQAALSLIEQQLRALDRISTESKHTVTSNVAAVAKDVQALDGLVTRSEHIVTVRRVEANAAGGLVGDTTRFASGGRVGGFPRLPGGQVPGSGNADSVPRTLDAGAFVLRKAAVRKYGAGTLAQLANRIARFAGGGAVARRLLGGPSGSPLSAPVPELLAGIDQLGGGSNAADYADTLAKLGKLREAAQNLPWSNTGMSMASWAGFILQHFTELPARKQEAIKALVASSYEGWLAGIQTARAMHVPITMEYSLATLASFAYAQGGAAPGAAGSDTVPALLTPGEYVVNRNAVDRYGAGFFAALNALALPARAVAEKVRGYARGGLVGARGGDLGATWLEQLALGMRRPALAYADATPAPSRTIRVELASGRDQVATTIDARDEARLLDLLRDARARSQ